MLSAKTTDNVTVIFPTIEDAPTPALPWVDVRIESAFVWGVKGTPVRRAARWDLTGDSVTVRPRDPHVVDLLVGPLSGSAGVRPR